MGLSIGSGWKLTGDWAIGAISSGGGGLTWTAVSTMGTATVLGGIGQVVNGSGTTFVAVGINSVNVPVYAISTNGLTWSTPVAINGTNTAVNQMTAVAYGSGTYVALGYDNSYNSIYTYSTNGTTWITPTALAGDSAGNGLSALAYDGTKFVAVGTNSTNARFSYSSNGISWASIANLGSGSAGYNPYDICYANGKFVVVGTDTNGYASVVTSANGTTWSNPSVMGSNGTTFIQPCGIAYTGSKYIATANDQINNYPVYSTSTNGSTWTAWSSFNGYTTYSYVLTHNCAYGNGNTVVIGQRTSDLAPIYSVSSDGGSTWTTPSATAVIDQFGATLCYGNLEFMAVGLGSSNNASYQIYK
jgi:hypothetical protein